MNIWQVLGVLAPIYGLLFWIGISIGSLKRTVNILDKKCPLFKEDDKGR